MATKTLAEIVREKTGGSSNGQVQVKEASAQTLKTTGKSAAK